MSVQRRNTRQRKLVLDAVRAHNDHPTADEIYLDVRKVDEKISRGTVYRNLNLLEQTGAISAVKAPGGSRFDWRVDGHAHIVCTECGCVRDALMSYDDELDARASQETGFWEVRHRTLFEGICEECHQARTERLATA